MYSTQLSTRASAMTEPRDSLPDVESMPPELMRVTDDDRASVAEEQPAARPGPGAILASALLPGSGHIIMGSWARGMSLAIPWVTLLGILFWSRAQVEAIRRTGTIEDYVALIVMAMTMISLWFFALYDLRAGAPSGAGVTSD